MSSRLHNKFHRHNHHTTSINDPRYPDSSFDPIASYTVPFQGTFVVQSSAQAIPKYTTVQKNVAIDTGGDIVSTGNIRIDGQYFGDGSQLSLGSNTSLIATVTGTPFNYGNTNPITSIVSSISGTGNLSNARYSTVAGGSANQVQGSGDFSFIASGSGNQTNVPNTFILGSNIIATNNQPNYTYVNNLSSLGTVYATTIGASSVNATGFIGNGNGINLSTSSLSATTTSLVNTTSGNLVTLTNTVSSTLNASITSLSATTTTLVNTVSTTLNSTITGLQSLSGNWQSVYSLVNTTTATTFNVKNLSATGFVNAVSANLGTTSLTAALNVSPLTIAAAASGSVFNQIQNTVVGISASTDISLYNNDGINYLDLGIASTGYNGNSYGPTFNVVRAGDSYVYATSGNLVQGAADVNGNQTFFTGGTLSGNERMRITNTGNVGIGTTAPNQALTVVGGISATGTLTTNSINVSGNVNASNNIYAASVYSNGVQLVNSSSQYSFYYSTATAAKGGNVNLSAVFANTSVLPANTIFDTLLSNSWYEIVYDVNVITSTTQVLNFALSSDRTFEGMANYTYIAGLNSIRTVQGTGASAFIANGDSAVNELDLPATQASVVAGGNNMYIRALIKTNSTNNQTLGLYARNNGTGQTLTVQAGSYRKITKIA
jgi:hypothetical protein